MTAQICFFSSANGNPCFSWWSLRFWWVVLVLVLDWRTLMGPGRLDVPLGQPVVCLQMKVRIFPWGSPKYLGNCFVPAPVSTLRLLCQNSQSPELHLRSKPAPGTLPGQEHHSSTLKTLPRPITYSFFYPYCLWSLDCFRVLSWRTSYFLSGSLDSLALFPSAFSRRFSRFWFASGNSWFFSSAKIYFVCTFPLSCPWNLENVTRQTLFFSQPFETFIWSSSFK